MNAILGLSGVRRNACAALWFDGRVAAACQQERLTRVRGEGLARRIPLEAMDEVLSLARRQRTDIEACVVAEAGAAVPTDVPGVTLDHHHAHAATAFLTSPFQRAAVVVCDANAARDVSVWVGEGDTLRDTQWPWRGDGFARLYSQCAQLFEFSGPGEEQQLEALAHLGRDRSPATLDALFGYAVDALTVDPDWRSQLQALISDERRRSDGCPVDTASAIQRRIGELLLDFLTDVRGATGCDVLCMGGGLFSNTFYTTLVRRSGLFVDVFVPINAGNGGLAVGATLALAAREGRPRGDAPTSAFLGPEYDDEAVKATLDGCKLSYAYVSESETLDLTVDALRRGHLVGWFQGRMEWGHRALGNRSILADPTSPYVLDNLNGFLRKRPRWRAFGVSSRLDDVQTWFCGPPASPFMEYEYGVRDERLRPIVPAGATSLRVQTVPPAARSFWELHKRLQQATGVGVIVNTSLNGFREPIVCTPRDAVRVFYGTGLDMLVLGRFILRK